MAFVAVGPDLSVGMLIPAIMLAVRLSCIACTHACEAAWPISENAKNSSLQPLLIVQGSERKWVVPCLREKESRAAISPQTAFWQMFEM